MPFYAVAKGRQPGIYDRWRKCFELVNGFKGARCKKFDNLKDAQQFLRQNKDGASSNAVSSSSSMAGSAASVSTTSRIAIKVKAKAGKGVKRKHVDSVVESGPPSKQLFRQPSLEIISSSISAIVASGHGVPLSKQVIRQPSVEIISSSTPPIVATGSGVPVVYTDGACRKNGRPGATAGYGVFWGDGHKDNVSCPLLEGVVTNNRAEYTAVLVALRQAIDKNIAHIIVRTDCQLLIDSLTKWRFGWKLNNWRKSDGSEVLNVDLLKQFDVLLEKIRVTFEHVKAHRGIYGNERADALARKGARQKKGNVVRKRKKSRSHRRMTVSGKKKHSHRRKSIKKE